MNCQTAKNYRFLCVCFAPFTNAIGVAVGREAFIGRHISHRFNAADSYYTEECYESIMRPGDRSLETETQKYCQFVQIKMYLKLNKLCRCLAFLPACAGCGCV